MVRSIFVTSKSAKGSIRGQVAFTRYGDQSRRQRRLMQQALSANAVQTYKPLLEMETHDLLKRILQEPEDYVGNLRRYAGGLTLLTIYGYRVTSKDDKFLTLAEDCVDILSNRIASGGGIWPVDIFPFCAHVLFCAEPDQVLNGTDSETLAPLGTRRRIQEERYRMEGKDGGIRRQALRLRPGATGGSVFGLRGQCNLTSFQRLGVATPCFVTMLLEDLQERSEKGIDAQKDFDIRWTANSMYSGAFFSFLATKRITNPASRLLQLA